MDLYFAVIKFDGEIEQIRGPLSEEQADETHILLSLPEDDNYTVEIYKVQAVRA